MDTKRPDRALGMPFVPTNALIAKFFECTERMPRLNDHRLRGESKVLRRSCFDMRSLAGKIEEADYRVESIEHGNATLGEQAQLAENMKRIGSKTCTPHLASRAAKRTKLTHMKGRFPARIGELTREALKIVARLVGLARKEHYKVRPTRKRAC